jgi:site-specific DNA-methyltransferase (adenine-specific)
MKNILCGDVQESIQKLPDDSIQAVITSPPYAMQRKLYQGVTEKDYPQWTVDWMQKLDGKLKGDGSVLIVIRPNISNGEVSDYVLRTRLAVREAGWKECEELIWYKPDGPPLGSTKRPRRAWEKILWFSKTGKPFVDLYACGNKNSTRTGGFEGSNRFGEGGDSPIAANQNRNGLKRGTSRITDVITSCICHIERGVMHPAMYPPTLVDFLVKTFSREGDTVLDPFGGSGQTAMSCVRNNRDYCLIDNNEEYIELAKDRIKSIS